MNQYKFTRLFSLLLACCALAGGWAVYALAQHDAPQATAVAVAVTPFTLPNDLFLDEQFGLSGAVYHPNVGVDGAAVAANGRLYLSGAFVYAGGHDNRQSGSWDNAPIGYGLIWDGQSWQGLPGKLWYERDSTPGPREAAVLYDIAANASGQIAVTANRLDWVEQPDGSLQPANKIALWDGAAWQTLDGGLNWFCSGGNGASCQTALADDGTLYVADTFGFTSGSGVTINLVGRWDGAQWQDMSAGLPASFVQIQVQELTLAANGDLYLRGLFQTGWGMNDKVFLYRWNGSSWTAVLTPTNIPLPGGSGNVLAVSAILPVGDTLYFAASGNAWNAGGDYAAVYQRAANGTISLLTTPFLQNDLDNAYPDLFGEVAIRGLAQDGQGQLLAGGFFYHDNPVNGAVRSVGRWDGAAWQPLGAGVNADSKGWYNYVPAVSALVSLPDGVYAHGRFHQIGSVAAVNVARWDGTDWTAVCDECNGLTSGANQLPSAYAFAWDGTDLAVGGRFSGAGDQIAKNVAIWDAINLEWRGLGDGLRLMSPWGMEDPHEVYALAYFQGDLLAGGKFNQSGAAAVSRGLARWDAASQQWQSFGGGVGSGDPNFDQSYVRALLADGDLLYVTGNFPQVNGQPMANFAIWDGATQSWSRPAAADWVSAGEFSLFERIQKNPVNGRIYFNPGMLSWDGAAFASAPLRLSTWPNEASVRYYYYSGDFTSLDGQPYSHTARYDAQTQSWSEMEGGLPDPVRNVSFHTSAGEQFVQFVAGDMVYFWSHTNQMWRPDLTQAATNNMVYPVGTLAEAFLADGQIFFAFEDRPTAVPLFFSWQETDKALTSHPAPALPDGATALHSAIAQEQPGDKIVMAARYSDGERMLWQLWRYHIASQSWEALSSPAAAGLSDSQPHALTTFGGHVYFGGALERAGEKVSFGFGRWLQASADLAVSQAAAQPLLVVGQPFDMAISVANLGPDTAVGVVLTNTLPGGVNFGGATSSQGSCAADGLLLTCELGLLPAGETAVLALTLTPLSSEPFTNTVAVSAAILDPDLSNNLSVLTLEAGDYADLTLQRGQSQPVGVVGQPLTLTWQIANQGQATAFGVVLSDTLPIPVVVESLQTPQGECVVWGAALRCDLGGIEAQESATVTAVFTPYTATLHSYTAVVTTISLESDPDNNSVSGEMPIEPFGTDLRLTLDAPAAIPSGEPYSLTIAVHNDGTQTAPDALLVADLPVGAILSSYSASQGSCIGAATITCTLGLLPGGGSATVSLLADLTAPVSDLAAFASVSGGLPDPDPANNEGVVFSQRATAADLSLSKLAALDDPAVGETQVYYLFIANHGPEMAFDIVLTDTLPAETTFAAASIRDGECAADGQIVACNLFALPAEGQAMAVITTTVNAPDLSPNVAVVAAATFDPDLSNNSASSAVDPAPLANVALSHSPILTDTAVPVGGTFSYTLTVVNLGETAALVTVNQASNTAVSHSPSQGNCTADACALGLLDVGQSATILATADTPTAGVFYASYVALPDGADANLNDNVTAVYWRGAMMAATAVSLTTTNPLPAVGAAYTVEVTADNNGDQPVAAELRYLPPLSTTLVSLPAGFACDADGPEIVCDLGTLPANGRLTLPFVWQADGAAASWHLAHLFTAFPESDVSDNQASLRVLPGGANLVLVEASQSLVGLVGENVTYTAVIGNDGPHAATQTRLTLNLPELVAFASASGAACQLEPDGATLLCELGTVAAGETAVATISFLGAAEGMGLVTAVVQTASPEIDR
jgi:uncharacterized repeat protein (TIGR01451 family)